MEKIILHSTEIYATFNENGGFRLFQDNECILENNMRRKDKIRRRKQLPKWCRTVLEDGKWIIVDSISCEGTCPDFYLKVRGQIVVPLEKEETRERETSFCSSIYYTAVRHIVEKRTRKYYADFILPIPSWSGWEEVSNEIVQSLTVEEAEQFKRDNPLPPTEEKKWHEVIDTIYKYEWRDNDCLKKTVDIIQPHSTGWWYDYRLDDECKLYIQKHAITDKWATHEEVVATETIAYKFKKAISSHHETVNSGKYESEDGYRLTYDVYHYDVTEYEITLENGEVHRVEFSKLVDVR